MNDKMKKRMEESREKKRKAELKMKREMENETELKNFKEFMAEEDGMGTVEIILIIVVLIGLVLIFKNQLRSLVGKIFKKITEESSMVMS